MTDFRILHLTLLDKFIPPFIDFLERNVEFSEHVFYLEGDEEKYPVPQRPNTIFRSAAGAIKNFINLLVLMQRAEKIMLHGLFNQKYSILLFFQPWLLKKCYWFIWGGDLYSFQTKGGGWKWYVKEFFRRPVIKRIGYLVTYVHGDVEKAREWYKARGEQIECILYLSNVITQQSISIKEGSCKNIQIGNSADPSNNHLEVLEKLKPYCGEDIKIFVPLAYGDENHALKVARTGKAYFGDKFVPMYDFMQYQEYINFLDSIDIAVFNHNRQQGMGNIINLAAMGKKIYLKQDTTSCKLLRRLGVVTHELQNFDLHAESKIVATKNSYIVREYFSEQNFLAQLECVFKKDVRSPF